MKIAVLSGKGGTGKTFVTVNLAYVAKKSIYLDCDVEEPNGHLFLKPEIKETEEIYVKNPIIDIDKCTGCRKCVDFCKFNALAFLKNNVKVFPELCHSCGGCSLLCPESAIIEEGRMIGLVQKGIANEVETKTGILNIGEASGVPIINEVLKGLPNDKDIFVDCPPGSSCLVMESIRDADYCVLVTEPTIYGVHNTKLVYQLVKLFDKPFGIVLNKMLEKKNVAKDFCVENKIPILAQFPYDSTIAEICSSGEILSKESEKYSEMFSEILDKIKKSIESEIKEVGG